MLSKVKSIKKMLKKNLKNLWMIQSMIKIYKKMLGYIKIKKIQKN